jgi:hypothetical protein
MSSSYDDTKNRFWGESGQWLGTKNIKTSFEEMETCRALWMKSRKKLALESVSPVDRDNEVTPEFY